MSKQYLLPQGWIETSVGEIAKSIQYGHTASAIDDMAGPRFLRITDIQNGQVDWAEVPSCDIAATEIGNYRLQSGDIVFARTGATTGKSYLIRNCPYAVFASYLIRLRMHIGILPTFVQAFFQSANYWRQIEGVKRGIGQPNVNASVLATIRFPLAPENEQRRIVAKIEELFSDLDAGVAALTRAKANLKRYRAAVLKAAVEGKLTEAWRAEHPDAEPASELLARILAERRRKWESDQLAKFAAAGKSPPKNWREKYVEPTPPDTSGLPELPAGWCWASVEQCATEVTVGHVGPMKDEYVAEGIPFLRSQNVRPLRYDHAGLRFVTDSFHNELKKSKLFGGELLVVRSGNIGEACVYPYDQPEANCADLVITRLVRTVDAHYAAAFVASPTGQALVGGKRTGSALSHFNVGAMAKVPLSLPPVAEQVEIVKTLAEKLSQIDAAERQIEHSLSRAARLRQSILKQAFEGKLVPQDPADEPVGVVLERLKSKATMAEKPAARKRTAKQ